MPRTLRLPTIISMRVDRWARWIVRAHPRAGDAVLAALLLPIVLFVRDPNQPPGSDYAPATTAVVMTLTCAALALRRRWPVPVLVLTTGGAAAVTVFGGRTLVTVLPMLALYTVARCADRRATVTAWAAAAVTLTAASVIRNKGIGQNADTFAYVAWTGMAAAVGNALRSRRAFVDAMEDRAVRAEQTREEEARRRVVEERLRIARELHDVVAHRIAVINVQAGVASHLLRTQPDVAEEALGHVRAAGRSVLEEVADILSVLRQPDDALAPTAPAPTLGQLDELVASFASAGLAIDWSLRGQPTDVGSALELVAYRLLQEALTNAHKHGTGTAHLLINYEPSALTLSVDNPVRPRSLSQQASSAPAAGHGLTGMRERAAAVGGVLEAAPADGFFHVRARLPVAAGAA